MIKFVNKLVQKEICRQFIKFCLIGLLNTIIDYSIYLFFSRSIGLYFLYANIISISVAMTFSFFANKYWTFQNKDKRLKTQYLKFAAVNVVYFFLNNSILFVLVTYLAVFDLLAKIIAIIIGLSWNFFVNRHWTFRNVEVKSQIPKAEI